LRELWIESSENKMNYMEKNNSDLEIRFGVFLLGKYNLEVNGLTSHTYIEHEAESCHVRQDRRSAVTEEW